MILHSSNEPGELSQWLCHDDSTINIVVLIIIIIQVTLLWFFTRALNALTRQRINCDLKKLMPQTRQKDSNRSFL